MSVSSTSRSPASVTQESGGGLEIIVRLFSEKLLNFFSRCSLENVTMENKELTVIKEDNGTTPNLSISNRVRLYMVFQKYHSAD